MTYSVNAFIVTLLPVYLYRSVVGMSLPEYGLYYLAVSAASTFILSSGYHNLTFWAKRGLDRQREDKLNLKKVTELKQNNKDLQGSTKEVLKQLKEEQSLNSTTEALAFSLAYSNILYLLLVVVLGFFLFGRVPAPFNYIITVLASAGIVNTWAVKILTR